MSKWSNDLKMDAALDYTAGSTAVHVCSSQPADRAAAIAASLATTSLAGGDFTKANGDTSGRKLTIAQKSAVSITASGSATHIALVDGTTLRDVTTCTTQALTSGGTVTIPAWKTEIADPS
jgi:hypothetical protein